MRNHGTLTKWNDDRGFGFITTAQSNDEIFVHVSAFPRDGVRPRITELISFETELGPNGKLRAIRVMRPGQRSRSNQAPIKERGNRLPSILRVIFSLLAIAAIGAYGYTRIIRKPAETPVTQTSTSTNTLASPSFKCDGRTTCSQMTSCAEAQYFIKHCPNTQMDGNNDGEPCEQQWCN